MPQKKKLQVFVSSTYIDLREERQTAVEAILMAGHIPAGMELFAAGDESQMNVIKRWIDESDIYMLILGGRYGSIEPKSNKSYIHLEYEYAVETHKPLFAVVVDKEYLMRDYLIEKVRKNDTLNTVDIIEQEHPDKLKEFQNLVCSRMVRFWRDPRDIKLAIMETLTQFSDRTDLIGWIPGNESVNSGAIAEELARLAKENTQLKDQLDKSLKENILLKEQIDHYSQPRYSGFTFTEISEELHKPKLNLKESSFFNKKDIDEIMKIFGDTEFSLIHAYWMLSGYLERQEGLMENDNLSRVLQKLAEFDFIQERDEKGVSYFYMTQTGREYLLRLKRELNLYEAEKYILP